MQPLNGRYLIEMAPSPLKKGSLFLPENYQKQRTLVGKVIAIPPENPLNLDVGDFVILEKQWTGIELDNDLVLFESHEVIAKVENYQNEQID